MSEWILPAARGASAAGAHRPGPALVGPDGQHRDQIEQPVGGADEAVAGRFSKTQRLVELPTLVLGHLRDVHLDRSATAPRYPCRCVARPCRRGTLGNGLGNSILGDVEHQQQRLEGQELVARDELLLGVVEAERAQRLLRFEVLDSMRSMQLDLLRTGPAPCEAGATRRSMISRSARTVSACRSLSSRRGSCSIPRASRCRKRAAPAPGRPSRACC